MFNIPQIGVSGMSLFNTGLPEGTSIVENLDRIPVDSS